MKHYFGLIVIAALFLAPSPTNADSYDGPYCFEDPVKYGEMYGEDSGGIRGTCRVISYTTVIFLDETLKNKYMAGTHSSLCYEEGRDGCIEPTEFSEIISPSLSEVRLTGPLFNRQDGIVYYFDTLVLLEKKPFLDLMKQAYVSDGYIVPDEAMPHFVVMNRNEMETWLANGQDYLGITFSELLGHFENGVMTTVIASTKTGSPFLDDPWYAPVYTFDSAGLAPHIRSVRGGAVENHIKENAYLNLDLSKIPPELDTVGITERYKKWDTIYTTPVTSPIKSLTDYWLFTEKNGEIVLEWDRTEYAHDNDAIDTTSREEVKERAPEETVELHAQVGVPVEFPLEKPGFFASLWQTILSWFK